MDLEKLIAAQHPKIEEPLKQWVESCDKEIQGTVQTLLQTYRMTNDCYDQRFEAADKSKTLSNYLEELENYDVSEPAKKLKGIVKANILLRSGQVKANAFQDPTEDFQRACSILEQIYDPNSANDLPKFLAQLNLGKYFRNMGMYNHRSDYYWRAFDEFKTLLENLVCVQQTQGGSKPWQDYIWLEAAMNLSRTELYLYHLRDAKIHLWQIYVKTAAGSSLQNDNQIRKIFYPQDCPVQTSDYIQINNTGETFLGTEISDKNTKSNQVILSGDENIKSNQEILINYSTQALIQLGIAFRKTRDYQIARRIFAFVLTSDVSRKWDGSIHYNVDALNNYAVCLRKSGMKLASIDEREKGFLKQIGMGDNDWKEEKKVKCLYFSLLTCLCQGQNSDIAIKNNIETDSDGQNDETIKNSVKTDSNGQSDETIKNSVKTDSDGQSDEAIKNSVKINAGGQNDETIKNSGKTDSNGQSDETIKKSAKTDSTGQVVSIPWDLPSKNRFATIEYIRASHWEEDNRQARVKEIEELLDKLLEKNPDDREILVQKGILLQQKGKLDESQKIFQKLYRESPQIAKGTIGLKAYYNMGCNLLAQKRFYEAQTYFQKIKRELSQPQSDTKTVSVNDRSKYLDDLPGTDLLADIDEGWCLMNVGKYSEAKALYDAILTSYKPIPARLGRHNQMKVCNNQLECCLQLLAVEIRTPRDTDGSFAGKLMEQIETCLTDIGKYERDNAITARHHGYYHLLLGKKDPMNAAQEYEQSMQYFETAGLYRFNDVYIFSGWVSAAYAWFLKEQEREKGDTDSVLKRVRKRLRYISGPYSMKSCAKLAEMLDFIPDKMDTEKDALYRSLARIQLGKNEEGYSLFQDLRENNEFCSLDPVSRGKLLAVLFRIYGKILEIKELCRYYPDPTEVHPVHYRPLDRLKGYLEEASEQCDSEEKPKRSGGLSLWNVAYMNDYLEGESFGVLMKHAALRSEFDKDITKFIPKLYPQSTDEDLLPFGEKNIYTTSFSLSKDTIPMWIAYADNAKGCAVTYSEDFLNLRVAKDSLTDVSPYSDADYPLYRVQYIDQDAINNSKNEKTASEKQETKPLSPKEKTLSQIQGFLEEICDLLKQLSMRLSGDETQDKAARDKTAAAIEQFVGNCLNEVRFLIKDKEYESEEEVRMIHYSREHSLETQHSRIPRLFIRMDREVRFEEVMLGPKIDDFDANEIAVWLYQTGKVKHIVRSKRHYR